jgi:hypothetical protein
MTGRTVRVGGRTVREVVTDGPKKPTEPPVAHPKKRMVRALSSDSPRATRVAQTVHGVQADGPQNHFQPRTTGQTDRNESAQEHATNTKNNLPNCTSRIVRTVIADDLPGM